MLYLAFIFAPIVLMVVLLYAGGGRLVFWNLVAIAALFAAYPTFALSGRIANTLIPLAIFFVCIRRSWQAKGETVDAPTQTPFGQ